MSALHSLRDLLVLISATLHLLPRCRLLIQPSASSSANRSFTKGIWGWNPRRLLSGGLYRNDILSWPLFVHLRWLSVEGLRDSKSPSLEMLWSMYVYRKGSCDLMLSFFLAPNGQWCPQATFKGREETSGMSLVRRPGGQAPVYGHVGNGRTEEWGGSELDLHHRRRGSVNNQTCWRGMQ